MQVLVFIEMEETRYNLRSKEKDYSIPIQLQLDCDEDFMAALRPSTSGQVSFSEHTDSIESDIDISDMIIWINIFRTTLLVGVAFHLTKDRALLTKQSILVDQLVRMISIGKVWLSLKALAIVWLLLKVGHCHLGGKQLNQKGSRVEKGLGELSNTILPPDRLRREAYIQKEVQARLQHLAN